MEAEILAHYISPNSNIVYQFLVKLLETHFQVCPSLSGRSSIIKITDGENIKPKKIKTSLDWHFNTFFLCAIQSS